MTSRNSSGLGHGGINAWHSVSVLLCAPPSSVMTTQHYLRVTAIERHSIVLSRGDILGHLMRLWGDSDVFNWACKASCSPCQKVERLLLPSTATYSHLPNGLFLQMENCGHFMFLLFSIHWPNSGTGPNLRFVTSCVLLQREVGHRWISCFASGSHSEL